jgi:thiol-disulfide isomerase/thioredoxin
MKILNYSVVIVASVVLLTSNVYGESPAPKMTAPKAAAQQQHRGGVSAPKTAAEFESFINKNPNVVAHFLDLGTDAQKAQEEIKQISDFPVTLQLASRSYDDSVKFLGVNLAKIPEAKEKFGIQGFSTVAFFKNGQVVKRYSGTLSPDDLVNAIQEIFGMSPSVAQPEAEQELPPASPEGYTEGYVETVYEEPSVTIYEGNIYDEYPFIGGWWPWFPWLGLGLWWGWGWGGLYGPYGRRFLGGRAAAARGGRGTRAAARRGAAGRGAGAGTRRAGAGRGAAVRGGRGGAISRGGGVRSVGRGGGFRGGGFGGRGFGGGGFRGGGGRR